MRLINKLDNAKILYNRLNANYPISNDLINKALKEIEEVYKELLELKKGNKYEETKKINQNI